MKYTECPECGTEIIEPSECRECDGSGFVYADQKETCLSCNGTGYSNDYYCPHCNWSHEE